MSIRKNTWDLDGHYDLTKSGQNDYLGAPVLFTWGLNYSGELAQNNRTPYSSPVQIPGTQWSSMIGGYYYSVAIKTDGTLWMWGDNTYGELGQNNTSFSSSPVQIPGNQWSSIDSGYFHVQATKTDGTLWVWGYNSSGQLGQNNLTNYSSPIQIPGTQWSSVAGGYAHIAATKTDGTLWVCGLNFYGQLGQNNTTPYSSPVQIPGTSWSSEKYKIGSPTSQTLSAIKTDGTLWAWGYNGFGNVGQNNLTNYSSPIQIPGTSWKYISNCNVTNSGTFATKTDGTLWSWGYNTYGQLGQNNRTQYSSPVQIPGNQWNLISTNEHSLATKTDETLWIWGRNSSGQLGQNNLTFYSSPVQIPGNSWNLISSGGVHSLAIQLQ